MKVAFDLGYRSPTGELPRGVRCASAWPSMVIETGGTVSFTLEASASDADGAVFTELETFVLNGSASPIPAGSHAFRELQPDARRFVRIRQTVSADAGSDPHRWSGRHFLEVR